MASLPGLTLTQRGAWGFLVVGALLTAPRPARAQGSHVRPQAKAEVLAVELESGCVTAGEFVERVKRRAVRARDAAPGEPARRVRVTIEGDERVVGRLVVSGNDGAVLVREVEGVTCQEVTDALALVLAVTLEPLTSPRPASALPSALSKATPSSGPTQDRPKRLAQRAPARPVDDVRLRHHVGGEVLLSAALIDRPMAGLGARYAVSREKRRGGMLLLTLGAFATFATDVPANHPGGGSVRFRLQAVEAGVCPVGVLLHHAVRLYPCGALTVGRLQAEGVELPGHRSDSAPFVAAAVMGRATIRLAGPLGLTGAAGLSFPFGGYSAVVTGAEESAGKVHPLGIIAGFGVLAFFP